MYVHGYYEVMNDGDFSIVLTIIFITKDHVSVFALMKIILTMDTRYMCVLYVSPSVKCSLNKYVQVVNTLKAILKCILIGILEHDKQSAPEVQENSNMHQQ